MKSLYRPDKDLSRQLKLGWAITIEGEGMKRGKLRYV